MKRLYILIIVTMIFLVGLGYNSSRALVWDNENQIAYCSENLLRLHIVANSSSPQDQFIKRQVRDLILLETRKLFKDVTDVQTAVQVASTNLSTLEKKIKEYLIIQGKNIPVRLELGRFEFPTRTYRNVTLPGGEYQALKVYLGEAQGNNWWCVLFPPLCLDNEEQASESRPEDIITFAFSQEKPDFQVEYRLKFSEIFKDVPQWVKINYMNVLKVAVMGSNGANLLEENHK